MVGRTTPLALLLGMAACHWVTGVDDFSKVSEPDSASSASSSAGPATGSGAAGGGGAAVGVGGGDQANGSSCTSNGACTSGHCVDGICCDRVCDQGCSSCRSSDTGESDGVCAAVAIGSDPKGSCNNADLGCATGELCCGESAPATVDKCPAVCSGGCADGTCRIACDTGPGCSDSPVVCPKGMPCTVLCSDKELCRFGAVVCPPSSECNVVCSVDAACWTLAVNCGDGPCSLACESVESCGGKKPENSATMRCGPNRCEVKAEAAFEKPLIEECGASCACITP